MAQPRLTILFADDDAFEAGYASSMLEDRGMRVLGFAKSEEAIHAVQHEPTIHAAVIGHLAGADQVIAALKQRSVPYLLLLPSGPNRDPRKLDGPVLTKPFAAYQVADWAMSVPQRMEQVKVT